MLHLKDGTSVTVEERVPVKDVRPGEPAPFSIGASVSAQSVSRVEWSARASLGTASSPGSRDTQIQEDFQLYKGRRKRIGTIPDLDYHDPPAPPFPALIVGTLYNLGTTEISGPRLVVAWFDSETRVVRVQEGSFLTPHRGSDAKVLLANGSMSFAVPRDDKDPIRPEEPVGFALWETPS